MAVQPDYTDSCMIALHPAPDVAKQLAIDGGLDPGDLHVTVAYCGDAADVDPADLLAAARAALPQPFTARVSGHARFTGGDQDVLVALIDAPQLEDLRRAVLDRLGAQGVTVPREHSFTAHCTLAYLDPGDGAPIDRLAPVDLAFDALSVVHGRDRTDLPMSEPAGTAAHPIAPFAREAYAAGWARSGGPMTGRVKAGCAAAIALACEHHDEPDILEVTLKLGSLEGVWARIYQRRDELAAGHAKTVAAAWRDTVTPHDLADTVRWLRRKLDLRETAQDEDEHRAETLVAATAAARLLIADLPRTQAWSAVRRGLRDALAAGYAEGEAGAIALAAERAGKIGLDWDLAFTDAYKALERLDQLWSDTDTWLAKALDRATAQLGGALATAAAAGSSYQDMVAAALEILGGEDVEAVSFIVDWALNTALSQGALDLYRNEGVTLVSFMTAGDGRVCPACQDAEDGSPYRIEDAEIPPLHPRCRCAISADWSLPAAFGAYLTAA